MNPWISFLIGLFTGGFVGIAAMCIFSISGTQSEIEEQMLRTQAEQSEAHKNRPVR